MGSLFSHMHYYYVGTFSELNYIQHVFGFIFKGAVLTTFLNELSISHNN